MNKIDILLLLLVGNVASVVAIVGELSSSSIVDFSFVSDKLSFTKSDFCLKFTGDIDSRD